MEKHSYYLRVIDKNGSKLVLQGWYKEIGNNKITIHSGEEFALGWDK